MTLRDLDDRLLPRLAGQLRLIVERSRRRRDQLSAVGQRAGARVTDPALSASLRRLDDRFTATGPLSLVRSMPQLAFLVVAAVFVAGAGIALDNSGDAGDSRTARAQAEALIPTTLGPPPGADIASYIEDTQRRAVTLSRTAPDHQYLALVSFDRYLTAAQASRLLGDLQVHKVLAHAPVPGAEVLPIPITTTVLADVTATFAAIALRKTRDRREFLALAEAIGGATPEKRQYRAFYTNAARTAEHEAAAYGGPGACVFAVLVLGRARELAALPALTGVRAVDLGSGADDTLQLEPLLPEQHTIVSPSTTPPSAGPA